MLGEATPLRSHAPLVVLAAVGLCLALGVALRAGAAPINLLQNPGFELGIGPVANGWSIPMGTRKDTGPGIRRHVVGGYERRN